MEQENFLNNNFYLAIKKACQYNYVCLYAQNQIKSNDQNGVFTAKDIFDQEKDRSQLYLEKKLELYSIKRNKYFSFINNNIFDNEIDKEFETQKNNLTNEFNEYYKTNKKFEDIMDGDFIIDEKFNSDLYAPFELGQTREEFATLAFAFSAYLHASSDYRNVLVARDIISTLDDDFNSNGYKSMFYGKPKSSNVFKLNNETLGTLIDFGKNTTIRKLKELDKIEKNIKKLGEPEIDSNLSNKHKDLTADTVILEAILVYIDAFKERYDALTKPPFSKKLMLKAKLNDASIGVNPFKKFVPDDFVYVHKSELEDVCNLLSTLNDTKNLIEFICKKTGLKYNFVEEEMEK